MMDLFKRFKTPPQPGVQQVKHILAVASAKGGVGKSTTAACLAYFLKESGAKVGLLDADIYGPSIPTMVSIQKSPGATKESHLIPAESNGIKILSMELFNPEGRPHILRGPMAASAVKQLLTQSIWGELDYLIIDYPPGTGDIQLTLSQLSPISGAILVTTPQEVALADARKAVGMFETLKIPVIGVIHTMAGFVCDSCDKLHQIFPRAPKSLHETMGLELLGEVPLDPVLTSKCDQGLAFDWNGQVLSTGARAYKDMAMRLHKKLKQEGLPKAHSMGQALESFQLTWRQ